MQTYYEINKEKIRKQQREAYQRNKEQRLQKQKEYYEANKEKSLERNRKSRLENPDKWVEYRTRFNEAHPLISLLGNCRRRARDGKFPCTITLEYLESLPIPTTCPVLGITIDNTIREQTISLDKIIPELGYVPGNVVFVSIRANRLKSDASLEELKKLVSFYTNQKPHASTPCIYSYE